MDEITPKACPWCGCEGAEVDDARRKDFKPFQVRCNNCGGCGPCRDSTEEAIAFWNDPPWHTDLNKKREFW